MRLLRAIVIPLLFMIGAVPASGDIYNVVSGEHIQDTIDIAQSGDIINIGPGIFVEQLYINNMDLTLTGAGTGQTIIRSPQFLNHPFQIRKAVISIQGCQNVIVTHLTVDGDNQGDGDYAGIGDPDDYNTNLQFVGIGYFNSGGAILDCTIINVAHVQMENYLSGIGVYAQNIPTSGFHYLTVDGLYVIDFQKAGMSLYGNGLIADVRNVTIDAQGEAHPSVQNGIEVGINAIAALENCTARRHYYSSADSLTSNYTAIGILTYFAQNVTITQSNLEDNQTGIFYDSGGGGISSTLISASTVDTVIGHGVVIASAFGAKTATGIPIPTPSPSIFPGDAEQMGKAQKSFDDFSITDCTFIGENAPATAGFVIYIPDYYFGLDIDHCEFTNWDVGLSISDLGTTYVSAIHYNRVHANQSYGLQTNAIPDIDARYNWWGDSTGPKHLVTNPSGGGDQVSDFVIYDPWQALVSISLDPAVSGPITCDQTTTLSFHYDPVVGYTEALRGYEVTLGVSPGLELDSSDITDTGALSSVGSSGGHFFYVQDHGDGTFTVLDALVGLTSGLKVARDLFEIVVHPASGFEGAGTVEILDLKLRDLNNWDLMIDKVDNATVEVDCHQPEKVPSFTATTAHQKVLLDWTPSPAADLAGYELYRGIWHDGAGASAYPEYDDLPGDQVPARPADRAQAQADPDWVLVDTFGPAESAYEDAALIERGIYFYEIFPWNDTGNFGPPADGTVRAINYWLGDLAPPPNYDGLINTPDVSVFGNSYGTVGAPTPHPDYNAECDIGPTEDHSPLGIPTTDDVINFEDLAILGINYGEVSPLRLPPATAGPPRLVWKAHESGWALVLIEPCAQLKGLHVTAELPAGAAARVKGGELLTRLPAPVFLQNIDRNGLDLGLMVLGAGRGLSAAGELFNLALPAGIEPRDLAIMARDQDNHDLEIDLRIGAGAIPELPAPAAFRLGQNHPNPFNPQTWIDYDLPSAQMVTLTVYAVDGSKVATLVHDHLPAGHYEAAWNGRDQRGKPVASGAYFYRIQAGSFSRTQKMILMK